MSAFPQCLAATGAVIALLLADVASSSAQTPPRYEPIGIEVEFQGGVSAGSIEALHTRWAFVPAPSGRVGAAYRLQGLAAEYGLPFLGTILLEGGWSRADIRCDVGACGEVRADETYRSQGFDLGIRLAGSPLRVLPTLRTSLTWRSLHDDAGGRIGSAGIGGEAALGLRLPLTHRLLLSPGVRVGIHGVDLGINDRRVEYGAVEAGIRLNF